MKIVEIEYSRTFNLGDYESERFTLKAELTQKETVESVYEKLKNKIDNLHSGKTEMPKGEAETPKVEMPTKHNKLKMGDLEDNIHPEIMVNLWTELDIDKYIVEVAFKEFDKNKQNWVDVNTYLMKNGFKWTRSKDQKKGSWIL